MAIKVTSYGFVEFLQECVDTKCGYIMGSKGQDPAKLAIDSWWFTQYDGNGYTAAQKAKALYWRACAPRVFDCNGLMEGYYEDCTGIDINTKARCNYAEWCADCHGTDMAQLPKEPGVAIFKYTHALSDIHHVGYLERPVTADKPDGDWYVIEASGVLSGVVRNRLSADKKWNAWGKMLKYMEYVAAPQPVQVAKSGDIRITGGEVNVRLGPGTGYRSISTVKAGQLFAAADNPDGWRAIRWPDGRVVWVSNKYSEVID